MVIFFFVLKCKWKYGKQKHMLDNSKWAAPSVKGGADEPEPSCLPPGPTALLRPKSPQPGFGDDSTLAVAVLWLLFFSIIIPSSCGMCVVLFANQQPQAGQCLSLPVLFLLAPEPADLITLFYTNG